VIPSPSPTQSVSSTTSASVSWSPISSSPMWSATLSPSTAFTPYVARSSSPTATSLLTLQPSQATSPTNSGITVGDLSAVCITLGALLFVSVVYAIHYHNKYANEKNRRYLLEVRSNPMHSQVRYVVPN
jgi:hypothetical protein